MPDQLLTFLKYIFLALLYLFFLRVLRAVWIELREPKPAPLPAQAAAPAATPASVSGNGRRGRHDGERLVILEPAERKDQEFPLSAELTVGRDLYVEDLGSTNGTYLNKKKVTAAVPMRKGDKLQIGKTIMEVRR